MGDKDYYKILGLERDALPEDIRRAYHRLAKESHPDASGAPDSDQRFRDITEAYEVLGATQARWEYDRRTEPEARVDSEVRGDQNQQNPGAVRGIPPGELAASQFTWASTAAPGGETVGGRQKQGKRRRKREKVKWVLGCIMCMLASTAGFVFLPCYVMPIVIMLAVALFVPRLHD
jgi:DnaJ-class molecular chaperone